MNVQYLRIIGTLYPDNRMTLMPGYLTERSHDAAEDPASPLRAELRDEDGQLLVEYRVPLLPYFAVGVDVAERAVRGKIPFHPLTRTVTFFNDRVMIHEIVVSKASPAVTLTWQPEKHEKGRRTITWVGQHPEDRPLQYFLRYTHDGARWQRASLRTNDTKVVLDFNRFPGGKGCRVAVVATDGVRTTTAVTRAFAVDVKPCQAMIFSPGDGDRFRRGEPVTLRGQGFHLEENEAETTALGWRSSLDGVLGDGPSLHIDTLSAGTHRIALTAGTGERVGRAHVTIHVGSRAKRA